MKENRSYFDKNRIYLFDGSKGFMLQKYGMKSGELAEQYNLTKPDTVSKIYKEYIDAGSDIIQTNTLCANRLILHRHGLADKTEIINERSISLAKQAIGDRNVLVAASIGPVGDLLEPSGPLEFDDVYDIFRQQIQACRHADILNFETFTDLKEMRIALLANKNTLNLPVICNMTFEKNNMTLMGQSPFISSAILKKNDADVTGVNCSHGPEKMGPVLEQIAHFEDFTCVKPNAGIPVMKEGVIHYDQDERQFCDFGHDLLKYNVGITGGCCGTTPEYIKAMNYVKDTKRTVTIKKDETSYIMSQYEYIDVEKPYETFEWIINNEDVYDCIDDSYDINENDCDAYILTYTGNNDEFIKNLVIQTQDVLKKPLIFNFDDIKCLDSALFVYCGIAGVTRLRYDKYGCVNI